MKNLKKFILLFFTQIFLFASLQAQLKEIDFIKGGVNDAEILFQEYLRPYANAFGANLNGGWYNTGKPHKLGGFDVTITFSGAWAPDMHQVVDLAELGLEASIGGSGTIAPTIAGKRTNDRPTLMYTTENPINGEDVTLAEYTVPNGTGLNFIPLPMAQASIGLPFGTDISGRFLPSLDLGNTGNIGLWGVGLKHSILQHIPVVKRIPIIDASIQGGYTKMNSYANVTFTPDAYSLAQNLVTDNLIYKGQKVNMDAEAYTVNLVLSQTLPVVTFYQAIGYGTSKTRVSLEGVYPFAEIDQDSDSDYYGELVVKDEYNIEDPIDAEVENTKDLRLNIGMRIKLGVLTIHGDYTKANYSMVTAGIGISFR
jgi:hypothetical protein